MFLSKLVLDPTHPQARRDLANAYEMHRTLSRVYAAGPDSKPERFLWRLEPDSHRAPDEGASILIQSATAGRWQCIQEMRGYYRAIHPDKSVSLGQLLETGRLLAFRLACNPTVTRAGKRYGLVKNEEQLAWLAKQGVQHGFALENVRISRSERISLRQGRTGQRITLQAVQFDGVLQVVASEQTQNALLNGIGHAKALGMGMLSLAPIR